MKTFKYAYAFLLDYTASKHEIPYTNAKCDSVLTLKNLFLSRLPKSIIDNIYGKTHQRLSRYKKIDSLIRSSEKAVHTLFKQYCKSCQAISKTWWFGEAEASPRDPLEEWVILQYDPGGRLTTIRQYTDTVWSFQAQYHSLEDRITLQFDPGGTNDSRLLGRLKNMWLTTTYDQVSYSIRVKYDQLTWKRGVVRVSPPPLIISKFYLVNNSSAPTVILGI